MKKCCGVTECRCRVMCVRFLIAEDVRTSLALLHLKCRHSSRDEVVQVIAVVDQEVTEVVANRIIEVLCTYHIHMYHYSFVNKQQ